MKIIELTRIMRKFMLLIILILSSSCTDDNQDNLIESENGIRCEASSGSSGTFVGPDRHYCCVKAEKTPAYPCKLPKHDCFPDIIVYPKENAIHALDLHISNNTVFDFFSDTSTFRELFPDLGGKALDDLRENIITLRKLSPREGIVIYYAVMVADTNRSPSYFYSYGETNTRPVCEEVGCNNEYIFR